MDTNGNLAGTPGGIGALLTTATRRLGSAPLLTYYDDRGGERTELSYATFDNWASKCANLLAEAVDAQPGQRLRLDVQDHWLGAVVTVAAWRVGLCVVLDAIDADVTVVAEADAAQAGAQADRTIVIGEGFGGRVTAEVPGVPLGDEVLAYADFYDGAEVSPDAAAIAVGGHAFTHAALAAAAEQFAGGHRVLLRTPLSDHPAVAATLVAPLVGGGSVVWCPRSDTVNWQERAASERATHLFVDGRLEPAGG